LARLIVFLCNWPHLSGAGRFNFPFHFIHFADMPQVHHWIAYSALPRNEALQKIQEAVHSPAVVTDFHFFSDLSASLQIEVPGSHSAALFERLKAVATLEAREAFPAENEEPALVFLQLNFSGGSGLLRHMVPEVPG
jgi:hypothetical protein